jgi:hypothetical protein
MGAVATLSGLSLFAKEPTGEHEPKAPPCGSAGALSWAAEVLNPIARAIRSTRVTYGANLIVATSISLTV